MRNGEGMLLKKLLDGCQINEVCGDLNIHIKNIKINSAEVEEGDCFIALVGKKSDGHKWADEAVAKGASAVICCSEYSNSLACVVRTTLARRIVSWRKITMTGRATNSN